MRDIHHYHVLVGLQGLYMPNSNEVHPTLRSALASACWLKDEYNDETWQIEDTEERKAARFHGSIYRNRYASNEHECIEVTTCDSEDCVSEICQCCGFIECRACRFYGYAGGNVLIGLADVT